MKSDDIKIAGTAADDRIKITPQQAYDIKLHKSHHPKATYRELGEMFSCSASQAYYICNEEALKKKKKKNRDNAHAYRDKDVRRNSIKKTRDKKRKIIQDQNKSQE